jgi:hypothetical protein
MYFILFKSGGGEVDLSFSSMMSFGMRGAKSSINYAT